MEHLQQCWLYVYLFGLRDEEPGLIDKIITATCMTDTALLDPLFTYIVLL